MHRLGLGILAVGFVCSPLIAAGLASCQQGARQYFPCELSFDLEASEFGSPQKAIADDLLHVEFRSPTHTTFLMYGFWTGGRTLHVRFTPVEAGEWTYKITSNVKRYDEKEETFSVAETQESGLVRVANVRHWRSSNKKPHLWLSASAPWMDLTQSDFEAWLDARKHDGFTHIRGIVLSDKGALKPYSSDGLPNPAYFNALDDRILAVVNRGLTADLILADEAFAKHGALRRGDRLEPQIRYLVGRYAGLNVTWQGIEHFETLAESRALLKDIGLALKKYDGFKHPRSTDALVTSSPLINDGWMNYIIEASPHPEMAAVEHQFTDKPSIHIISSSQPEAFRHELWNATTNGQYPSVAYEALRNDANVKAIATWFRVVSDTRHWELEPYFGVAGARGVGLDEVEYLCYAEKPGIVEINLPKHKYNPVWVNPATGEELPLKDYRGEVMSDETPDNTHDWVLTVPRDGRKESMARSYYFESQDPPLQEVETDAAKAPFEIAAPPGDSISVRVPAPYKVKLTRANRATRFMQYVWVGEVVAGGEGPRVIGYGSAGTLQLPPELALPGAVLNLRLEALNANGKAYEIDRVYTLTP